MAFNDNPYSSLVNDPVSETSPILRHEERRTQVPSSMVAIPMTFKSIPSLLPIRLSKRKRLLRDSFKSADPSTRIEISAKDDAIGNLGYRLQIRKVLTKQRALVSDIMCFFGIVGIILMIIENELSFRRTHDASIKATWFIKLTISLTTGILLGLICYYHLLDLKFYANQNCLAHWSLGLTKTKMCFIIGELLICAIHPMPRGPVPSFATDLPPGGVTPSYAIHISSTLQTLTTTISSQKVLSHIDIDVALGLPMFCRLYLLSRSIMFHSRLVRDTSTRSIGYLNQVPIDFFFLSKTYLERWPITCMMTCFLIVMLIGSWCLRACDFLMTKELKPTSEHIHMSDTMWLFIITFTTVGYGDLFPRTYCSRCIAALIGLYGILVTSLAIAIVTQKLLFTREEKYVHTFVLNTELAKDRVIQAANVVKFALKVWYLKSINKHNGVQIFRAKHKLYRSICLLKQIRDDQAGLIDNCVGTVELMTIERKIDVQTIATGNQMMAMKDEINKIEEKLNNMNRGVDIQQNTTTTEEKLNDMNRKIDILQNTINALLDKVTK